MRCLFSLLALFLFSFCLKAQNSNLVTENVIRIKVKESFVSKLENTQLKRTDNGVVLTGIESINQLNTKNSAISFRRLFSDGGKFEARRRAHGLHLWYEVTFGSNKAEVEQLLADYASDMSIQMAEPIYKKAIIGSDRPEFGSRLSEKSGAGKTATFNDPRINEQWHYNNTGQTSGLDDADIDLFEAWDVTAGSADVIVSIHDGGVDYDHEDLTDNMWVNTVEQSGTAGVDDDGNGYIDDIYGYNFVDGNGNVVPDPDGHGTHVAGTVGAVNNNGTGVAGVAGGTGVGDGTRLMSCQVFTSGGGGFAESYAYAADNGAIISQNSWGYTSPGFFEQAVLDGIDYFIANAGYDESGNPIGPMQGGIVIFAAGNSDSSAEYYPGFYDPILTVASTNHNDQKAWYSNYGTWVDISAPGGETAVSTEGVLSTLPNNTYGFFQGTSMACPHVSGVAALIVAEYGGSGFTPVQLRGRLVGTTDDIEDLNPTYTGQLGSGRMNAFGSLLSDDGIAPDAIADLVTSDVRFNKITLSWTAPADADNVSASSYEVRYSTANIDSANFASATLAGYVSAQTSGSAELYDVVGLVENTTYYFAIKSYDFFSNASDISNIASIATEQAPEISVTPTSLTSNLFSGDSEVQNIVIENVGLGTLDYSLPAFTSVSTSAIRKNKQNGDILTKGEKDTRRGNPVLTGAGDDGDTFGYQWIDSNEAGGPGFNWVEISGIGTQMPLSDDDFDSTTLQFNFPFYQEVKNTIYVSSNGFLSFSPTSASSLSNSTLPNPNTPNDLIALLWDDLNPSSGGEVYYLSEADRFIVQYNNVPLFGSGGSYTFQCILYPNGDITIQYLSLSSALATYTSGIENSDGTGGLEIAFNAVHAEDNLAVSISRQKPLIESITPVSGVINPGEQVVLDVNIQALGLESGTYEDEILISSNDPENSTVSVPLTLNVTGAPSIDVVNEVNFSNTFINGVDSVDLIILNNGTETLDVNSLTLNDSTDFNVDTDPFSLAPEESKTLTVYYTPKSAESHSAILSINSNDDTNSTVEVELNGQGVEPPVMVVTPTSIIENLLLNETSTRTITVTNAGASELNYSLDASSTSFSVVSSGNQRYRYVPLMEENTKRDNHDIAQGHAEINKGAKPFEVKRNSAFDVIFSDNMDDNNNPWTTEAYASDDLWHITGDNFNSPDSSWNCAIAGLGNYDNGNRIDNAVVTPSLDLQSIASDSLFLEFYENYNTESGWDYCMVDVTVDDGASWQSLRGGYGNAPSGNSNGWIFTSLNLSEYIGEIIKIRFYFDTGDGGFNNFPGWFFDDVVVRTNESLWFDVTDTGDGVLGPGESATIEVTFDASGLEAGSYEADIIINSNDPSTPQEVVATTLNVCSESNNNPPVLDQPLDDILEFINEGSIGITLDEYFSDSDGDDVMYTFETSNPLIADITVSNNMLQISSVAEGKSVVTVTAYDGRCGEVSDSFELTIDTYCGGFTNTPPKFVESLEDVDIKSGETYTVNLLDFVEDEDGHSLTFDVTMNNPIADISINNGILSIAPLNIGDAEITLTVEDERCGILEETLQLRIERVTGLSETEQMFTIFPVPVDTELILAGINNTSVISIRNLHGQIVYQRTVNSSGEHRVSTNKFKEGIYILRISSGDIIEYRRLTVKH